MVAHAAVDQTIRVHQALKFSPALRHFDYQIVMRQHDVLSLVHGAVTPYTMPMGAGPMREVVLLHTSRTGFSCRFDLQISDLQLSLSRASCPKEMPSLLTISGNFHLT